LFSSVLWVNEPVINETYNTILSLLNETLIKESEENIKNGNYITHIELKQEIKNWRHTK